MAANRSDVFLLACVRLCGRGFEGSPGVEAAHEAVGLVSLPHQSQLPGVLGVFGAHVLDVDLEEDGRRSVTDIDLHHREAAVCYSPDRL